MVLSYGLAACASSVEERDRTSTESSSVTANARRSEISAEIETDDTAASVDNQQLSQREILTIGPRPDRNPPLQDCNNLNQQEMNICANENYKRVSDELKEVYRQIATETGLTIEGIRALDAADLAWSEYRDLDCDFERSQFEGGSIEPLIYSSCLEARTNIRINELYEPVAGESSYQVADSALNAAYQGLIDTVDGPREETLVDAQLAWIEYRDRQCAFEASYGAADIKEDQCKARLSEQRTRQIRAGIEQNNL